LLLATDLLCTTAPLRASGSDGSAAQAPAERAATFATAMLARRQRKLMRIAAHLLHASSEERHAARIAAKRLRYIAEFFAPLFPGKRTRAYLDALANAQDVLGRLNDAVTAASLAGELAGPGNEGAAGAVHGWVAAQAAAVEPILAKAWRRFDAARPFWPSS
jgi:CHAD domain-containing protein